VVVKVMAVSVVELLEVKALLTAMVHGRKVEHKAPVVLEGYITTVHVLLVLGLLMVL
jgi:hypothetical protein